jgi:hypothetical protein
MKLKRVYRVVINQIYTFYVIAFNEKECEDFYKHRILNFYYLNDMPIVSCEFFYYDNHSYSRCITWVEMEQRLLEEWGR